MSNEDCGSHLVRLYLEFVGKHEIDDGGWQACKKDQCATL
jgi:hypothetical protein